MQITVDKNAKGILLKVKVYLQEMGVKDVNYSDCIRELWVSAEAIRKVEEAEEA